MRQALNLGLAIVCFFIVALAITGRIHEDGPTFRTFVGIAVAGVGVRRLLMFISEEKARRGERSAASRGDAL